MLTFILRERALASLVAWNLGRRLRLMEGRPFLLVLERGDGKRLDGWPALRDVWNGLFLRRLVREPWCYRNHAGLSRLLASAPVRPPP